MSFPHNKFVIIPQQYYEELASVYNTLPTRSTLPIDRPLPVNFNCVVLLERLKADKLANCSNINSGHVSLFPVQNLLVTSTVESQPMPINYRQELADFDFPTNGHQLTTADLDAWCIKKATDIINESKTKTEHFK